MMKEKKKANGVQLLIRAIVRDPDGKIINDTGEKPSRSFVIQFLEFFYIVNNGGTPNTLTVTSGGEGQVYNPVGQAHYHGIVSAAVNYSGNGIVVGTGDTAETNTDYKLETQLTEGTGAGNITHGECVVETAGIVGVNVDLEVKRSFINSTGIEITVKEAGIYSRLQYTPGAFYCIIRDVLAPSIAIPDKCSLTIYYTLRTTV